MKSKKKYLKPNIKLKKIKLKSLMDSDRINDSFNIFTIPEVLAGSSCGGGSSCGY